MLLLVSCHVPNGNITVISCIIYKYKNCNKKDTQNTNIKYTILFLIWYQSVPIKASVIKASKSMAEKQKEMYSAMAETPSSKSTATQIEGRKTLSWAQIVIKSISNSQKSATSTKKNKIQSEPKKSSTQKLIEEGEEIEQRANTSYLDSISEQPRNQLPSADLLNLSSKNQPGVVNQDSSTGGQPNPNSDYKEGGVKGAISGTTSCSHYKKSGHEKERCWFLHPHLQPKWWKVKSEGKNGEIEREKAKNPKGEKRKGFGSSVRDDSSEESKAQGGACEESGTCRNGASGSRRNTDRIDQLESLLSSLLSL